MRRFIFIVLFIFSNSSCAYRWGFRDRAVPGGYKQVAIPIFKNTSNEVGIETDFTNALIRQFERSQVAHITSKELAPVRIDGTISRIDIVGSGGGIIGAENTPLEPDASLRTEYQLVVTAKVQVRRQSDEKVIWEGEFKDQRNYQAPRILEPVVNSADATYNESARHHTLADLADEMMSEVHDRITENF